MTFNFWVQNNFEKKKTSVKINMLLHSHFIYFH